MKAFCPKCGKETDGLGPRGLCDDCYVEENELLEVPERLTVTVCSSCGRAKIGHEWVDIEGTRELLYNVLDHHIDGENVVAVQYTDNEDKNAPQTYDITVLVERTVDGQPLQEEVETALVIEKDQCLPCSRFNGGYFTYILQVRTDTGPIPDEAVGTLMDRAADLTNDNREHFISDVKEHNHGVDIYVSTRTMAEVLLKELEQHYEVEKKRSKELIGEEEGKRVYRSVISARILRTDRQDADQGE